MNSDLKKKLIEKNPKLSAKAKALDALEKGAVVVHRSWGLGRITDITANLNLVIDFPGKPQHEMDAAFCVDKLEIIPVKSLVVDHMNNLFKLDKVTEADLIIDILKEYGGKATPVEIERTLFRLYRDKDTAKGKKVWTAAKAALAKDPRVQCPVKSTDSYVLREVEVRPEEVLLLQFFDTKAIKKQIELAARLFDLSKNEKGELPELGALHIREQLPNILATLTEGLKGVKALNPGERLYGIWVRNDLARFLHPGTSEDPAIRKEEQESAVFALEPTSASIIEEQIAANTLPNLAELIPSTHQYRLLDLISRCRQDWVQQSLDLLRRSRGKFTGECFQFLIERKKESELRAELERWLNEQQLSEPVLCWIVKNRATARRQKLFVNLMNQNLLRAIFKAVEDEALKNASSRRIQLAELVSEDRDLIKDLLAKASEDEAYDLAMTLWLNHGFEDLTKRSLLARFIHLYPRVGNIVSHTAEVRTTESAGLVISEDSFQRLQSELERIVKINIPETQKAIEIAKEHGDLRENSEYKMAKQDLETFQARKGQLETDLARARHTDFSDAPTDSVGIGTVVKLRVKSAKKEIEYAILGAFDSDPDANILSYQTPIGQALLHKKVKDVAITIIDGVHEEYEIIGIKRWIDVKK